MPMTPDTHRNVALFVLIVLPAVAAARLGLDARATSFGRPGVEAEHDVCCSRAHDHELCALLAHTPCSPTASLAGAVVPSPSYTAPLTRGLVVLKGEDAHLEFARAPPSHST
jgi:hypothetical protein